MSQDSHKRRFPFTGSDADYINFLEAELEAVLAPSSRSAELYGAHSTHPDNRSSISNLRPEQPIHSHQPQVIEENSHQHKALENTQSPSRSIPQVEISNSFLARQEPPSPPRSPSSNLQFQFFNSAEYNKAQSSRKKEGRSNNKPRRKEDPQALKELNFFIGQLKNVPGLMTTRRALGLTALEINRNAVQFLCGHMLPDMQKYDQALDTCPFSSALLVQRGCAYGALHLKLTEYGELLVNLTQYQGLIFVSLCQVLSHIGVPRTVIEWMLGSYVKGHWKSLQRLRLGSLWINRCMSKLLNKFGAQVWDLILLCPATVAQYGRFSGLKEDEGRSRFVRAMGPICENLPAYNPEFIPYCIPCIIKVIAGEELELLDICNALEYDFVPISAIYASYFENILMTHAPDDTQYEEFNPYEYAFNGVMANGEDIMIGGFDGQLPDIC